jgi:hypothetical protein
MLPAGDLSSLPLAAPAAVDVSRSAFLEKARGHVRARNDSSHDNRASHFAAWLSSVDVDQHTASVLIPF